MEVSKKESLCLECNLFGESCDGISLYIPTKQNKASVKLSSCVNLTQTKENTKNPLQNKAFCSLYRTKKAYGMSSELAFCEAIVQTSDEAFQDAQKKRPELIRQFKKVVGK